MSASQISIDAGQISRFLDRLVVEFELKAASDTDNRRPGRWIYDTVDGDRRQRWRQLHYRSVVKAERFIIKTVRAPRAPSNRRGIANAPDQSNGVEAALAGDLVRLAAGETTTVVLLAGSEAHATAVRAARELGAEVVLLVPAGCGSLVAEGLREAATLVIALHPEVFGALFEVRDSGWRRRSGGGSPRSASVGAAC